MNGDSIENAINISAADEPTGVGMEYRYIVKIHGKRNIGWRFEKQFLLRRGKRCYDVIHIITENGEKSVLYFDITEFFGKFDMKKLSKRLVKLWIAE